MKKVLIVFLFIVMSISLFNVNAAKQSTQRPSKAYDIAVTLINQEPDPAEPGRYVDVRFKFDNNGSEEARNVEIEILPEYPFSLDKGREAVRSIGTLQSRQKGDVGVVEKYRLRIDRNAIEGENEIKIRYRVDNTVWIEPEEFFIGIRTPDIVLSVDSVAMDKNALEPGVTGKVKIRVSNNADSLLKNIKANLDLGNVPIVPLGSTNEKSIYKIDSGNSHEFEFMLLAEPDAKSNVYKVPLKITYSDNIGNEYIKNSTIGLIVGSKPDISVTLDESEIVEAEKSGEIIVKVVNKGVTDIKFANLKLISNNYYRILSSNEIYLGNIDSDDFETADFDIFVEKTDENQIKLPLILEYKDANNNDFNEPIELKLSLYSASEAKRFGLKKENGFIGILIIIIIVTIGLWYYRKYHKKRKV